MSSDGAELLEGDAPESSDDDEEEELLGHPATVAVGRAADLQSATPTTAVTLVGVTRTTISGSTALRRP